VNEKIHKMEIKGINPSESPNGKFPQIYQTIDSWLANFCRKFIFQTIEVRIKNHYSIIIF
jgi:hypothetical protein